MTVSVVQPWSRRGPASLAHSIILGTNMGVRWNFQVSGLYFENGKHIVFYVMLILE